MLTYATRSITITQTGDVNSVNTLSAAQNQNAPGDIDVVRLAGGDNSIPVPTGGTTPKAVTIVKPAGSTVTIKLKGAGGDTGIVLRPIPTASRWTPHRPRSSSTRAAKLTCASTGAEQTSPRVQALRGLR